MNNKVFSMIAIVGSGIVIGTGSANAANLTVFNVADNSAQDRNKTTGTIELLNYPLPGVSGMNFTGTVIENINSTATFQQQSIVISKAWIETGSSSATFSGNFVTNNYDFKRNINPANLSFTIYGTIQSKVLGGIATGDEKLYGDLNASNFVGKQPLTYRSPTVPDNAPLPRQLSRKTDSRRGFLPAGSGTLTSSVIITLGANQRLLFPDKMLLQAAGVPEPSAILGAGVALGFGTFFKRKLFKKV